MHASAHRKASHCLIIHHTRLQCFGNALTHTSWRGYMSNYKARVAITNWSKRAKSSQCCLAGGTVSLGAMATELLQYFMLCSHEPRITTACIMLMTSWFLHLLNVYWMHSTSIPKPTCFCESKTHGYNTKPARKAASSLLCLLFKTTSFISMIPMMRDQATWILINCIIFRVIS